MLSVTTTTAINTGLARGLRWLRSYNVRPSKYALSVSTKASSGLPERYTQMSEMGGKCV
jgi:hypothetical protein